MPNRITRLTDQQRAAMKPWAEKWIKIGLSCEPANREAAEAAYRACYRFAGLRDDVPIIWVESPIVGALAASIAASMLHDSAVGSAVRSAVHSAVGLAVGSAVRSAVRSAVDSAVHSAVDSAVRSAVDSAVDSAVHSAVRSAVDSAVRSAVGLAVSSAVDSAVGLAVRSAVDSAVDSAEKKNSAIFWHFWCGGQFWSYWPAFESFFRSECSLVLAGDLPDRAAAWAATSANAGYWWPNKSFIIACDRPRHIRRDDAGRLHSETDTAIEWRDGWGLHFWHGTRVPDHWITERSTLDPRDVIRAENVEQRAAGAAIVGWPKMIDVLEARVIDRHESPEIGELIEMTLPGLDHPGRFLKARCPRNGLIVEGVPDVSDIDGLPIDTALAAQAWRIGDPQSEYIPPQTRT
jgi:hypothetical protein